MHIKQIYKKTHILINVHIFMYSYVYIELHLHALIVKNKLPAFRCFSKRSPRSDQVPARPGRFITNNDLARRRSLDHKFLSNKWALQPSDDRRCRPGCEKQTWTLDRQHTVPNEHFFTCCKKCGQTYL